jgi:hypothetical protein
MLLLQSLQWQLSEKEKEGAALQEQVQMVHERQDMQMASLQTHLQVRNFHP